MKRLLIFPICLLILTLISSCGSYSNTSNDYGSISFDIALNRPAIAPLSAQLPGNDICIDYGITTINATVLNSTGATVKTVSWNCSAHGGTITGIPAGSDYTVRLEGIDSISSVAWKGEISGISVSKGSTSSAGTITMSYIGSDTTAPTITSTNPSDNATSAPVTTLLTATFSEQLAVSSINAATFTVKIDITPVSGSVTYDSNTKRIIFIPSSNLSYSTAYTATVTTGVEDMAGNNMQSDYSWGFTTEAPPTSAPSAPTGVNATPGNSQITITWDAVPGATYYNIYWSTNTGVTKTTGTQISGITTTSYTHTGLTNDTTYYYVATAVNSFGESSESSEVSATTGTTDTTSSKLNLAYNWTMTIGGSEGDEGRAITLDLDNNIYITGYFNGTVDFDPSSEIDSKTEITGPNGDYFLTKINFDGSYGWTNIIESNDPYGGNKAIVSDSSNNVYLTGKNTSSDMIVIKYNSIGNVVWTKIMDGNGYVVKGNAIELDANDNIYITGTFYSTVDFDPEGGNDNKTSNGESDIFITKLNRDGSYGWTKVIGGSNYDFGSSIAIDTNNNIYITGMFRGTVDFNPDGGGDNKTSNGIDDIFITKINNDGSYGWTKVLSSIGSDDDVNCVITDQNNNLYVTGAFYSETDFVPSIGIDNRTPNGSGDIFIAKLNNDGSYGWTKTIGGLGSDMGNSITVDSSNNIYLIGTFSNEVDFDPRNETDNKISKGDWDIFITKYSDNGNYGGVMTFGGTSGEGDIGNSIIINSNGNVFTTGRFFLTVDFDPTSEIDSKISNGDSDIFISKFTISN